MKRHVVFLALFVSLLALFVLDPINRVKACGPYPPTGLEPTFSGGDYLSFVEFDLANDSLYKNYYYYEVSRSQGPGYPAYNEEHETMNTYRDNLEEWRKLLGPEINLETTYKLVYKSSLSELNQLYGILIENDVKKRTLKLAPFLKDSRFQTMISKRQIDLLKYLIFAKTCEPQVTADDPWSDPPKSRDYKLMDKLIQKGLKAYQDCPAEDLKVRYAYQIIRLAHYAGFYDDCVKLYDQLVPGLQTKSIFRYWSLRLKAGALYNMDRKSESLVLTSLIFDQSPNQMDNAYQDFFIPSEREWTDTLGLVQNNHRKATLWMLRGLKEKRIEIEPLRQMFKLEPDSSRLEVMLVRQMNAIEANYLNSDFFFDQNKAKIDRQSISDLRSLALDGAESGKVRQPALWYMTAGYMSLLRGNVDQARTTLAKASEIPTGNTNLKNQIRLLANLTELVSEGKLSKEREYALWQSMTWLKSLKGDGHNQTAPRALMILVAQKYLTAGNFDRAVCYLAKADYNFTVDFLLDAVSTQDDLVSLERLLAKTGKDPVDAWLTKGFPYSLDDLHYIAGTKYMRKEAFREGLGEYRKIARTFWPAYWGRLKNGREWASFFNDDIYLRTSFGASVPRKSLTRYDKLTFTEKLVSLLDQAEKKPQNASTDYYQIANGLSYSPFWGYNDIIWKGTLVESIKFFSPKDYPFNVGELPGQMEKKYDQFTQEYASYRIPVKYYEKAMRATKNREVAAKCCFLILQTENKSNWFIDREPPRYPEYRGVLSKDYKDTKFYREILKECPVR